MEFNARMLKEEQYADTDLDSVDDEALIEISKPLSRPSWISRFLYSASSLHLLLLLSYTLVFIWLAKSYPSDGCARRDMIYCKTSQNTTKNKAQTAYNSLCYSSGKRGSGIWNPNLQIFLRREPILRAPKTRARCRMARFVKKYSHHFQQRSLKCCFSNWQFTST